MGLNQKDFALQCLLMDIFLALHEKQSSIFRCRILLKMCHFLCLLIESRLRQKLQYENWRFFLSTVDFTAVILIFTSLASTAELEVLAYDKSSFDGSTVSRPKIELILPGKIPSLVSPTFLLEKAHLLGWSKNYPVTYLQKQPGYKKEN